MPAGLPSPPVPPGRALSEGDRRRRAPRAAAPAALSALAAALLLAGCGHGPGAETFTRDMLMDPEACATCHPDHVKEWSSSMHAYAADDPVFVAMNARGQRETKGALGTFCLDCHAPLAVRAGAATGGVLSASTPQKLRGVTCYFCHSVDKVKGTHDDPLELASDGVLRGGFTGPVPNGAHASAYAPLLDRESPASASLCGSCHDIVSPAGGHIERTFAEWQGTVFSHGSTALPCGQCHMAGRDGPAAQDPAATTAAPTRRVHEHTFPGVDVALTSFPAAAAQKAQIQAALDTTLQGEICVKGQSSLGNATLQIVLDNVGAGHSWPSGATQDRRAWVEVIAYAKGQILYQSGAVPDGASVTAMADPDLWLIRDCMFDAHGKQAAMFWSAASVESNLLPGPTTIVPTDPAFYLTHVVRTFPRPTSIPPSLATFPDRVTMRVRLVPVGLDVLDDLIQSGDLDPAVKSKMPAFTLEGTRLEWTPASVTLKYLEGGIPVACVSAGLSTGASSAHPAPEHSLCKP